MDQFLNIRYKMVSQENYEEYLKFIDKGFVARKLALSFQGKMELTKAEDGKYVLTTESSLFTSKLAFRSGEEFIEVKPDGVKVKSLVTIDGNVMTQTQVEENGRISKHIRTFYEDKVLVTSTGEGMGCEAHFVWTRI